ncbi:MAG: tRNA pseudouridine(55) synthase TruB [Vicinamibacterales bacterium]
MPPSTPPARGRERRPGRRPRRRQEPRSHLPRRRGGGAARPRHQGRGHTGTLDPMATGVVVLLVGRATRLARFMTHDLKAYEAAVTFGRATDTYDAEGATTGETGRWPDETALAQALATAAAAREQVPPAYSAKKVDGEVAYKAARRDAPLALPPVPVTVHDLTLRGYADGVATLSLTVSSGFYVRSLAHDLGVLTGTGAHLSALRRVRAGAFDLTGALTFEALKAAPRGGLRDQVRPIETLLPDLRGVPLTDDLARRIRHGQTVQIGGAADVAGAPVRLLDPAGRLLAIARATPVGSSGLSLQPLVVLG